MGRKPNTPIDGAKLCEMRIAKNMSLEEVAKKIHCNRSSLSRWERGLFSPPPKVVVDLIVLLGGSEFVKKTGGKRNGK